MITKILKDVVKDFGLNPFFRYFFILFFILIIILLYSMAGCTTPTPDMGIPSKSPATLQPSLEFSVDGVNYVGTATLQRSTRSVIKFKPKETTQVIQVSTCAGRDVFWKPDVKKDFTYEFIPMFDVENRGACPIYLTMVTKEGEWYQGIIDFTNATKEKDAALQIGCNRRWYDAKASYLCSVWDGIPVYVKSAKKIVIGRDTTTTCPEPIYEMDTNQYKIPTRAPGKDESALCVYVIITKDKEYFRLTNHVYTSILKVFPPDK